jgi:hypothetical protein
MIKFSFPLVIVLLLSGCKSDSSSVEDLKKQCNVIATDYAMNRLKNGTKKESEEGFVLFTDKQKTFLLNPSKVFTGFINDDENPDAIVSLDTFINERQTTTEHLILINNGKKLILNRVVESDMKVLGIKDSLIIAEISAHSRNSPLFDCASCLEVVKYRFREGALIKTDK